MADDDLRKIAEQLAPKLNELWTKLGKSVLPGSEVASGLEKILNSKLLNPKTLLKFTSIDDQVALALDAIGIFQKVAGLNEHDSFLGLNTNKKLKEFNACDEQDFSSTDIPPDSKARGAYADHSIMYYWIEPELRSHPLVGGPDGPTTCGLVLQDAIFNWVSKTKLILNEPDPDPNKPNDANIHIKWDNLGGKGGVLGIANIGGKNRVNQLLTLRFDRAEDWDYNMFLNTATHELGHILGLTHSNGPNEIMSAFANGLTEPTAQDIARMQEMWGKSRRA